MSKLSITLDVSKINKAKIIEKKYQKNGVEVTEKNYKIDVIPCKEQKVVAQGETWIMKKTHFVVEAQTKAENAQKLPPNYIGEGFEFEDKPKSVEEKSNFDSIDYPDEQISIDEIPF